MTMSRRSILSALELKLSPVMTAIALAALMWLLARNTPGFALALELRLSALIVLFGAGAAIGCAGIWSFRRARTTVNPWRPHASSALVVSGVYRRTRNPMYLGLLLALAGWGLYLANIFSLLLAITFVPYMNRFQIRPEERALEQTYGEAFIDYCRRVRRWL
jgi:protein-S-isoprenylcysteine O-methyltransferase Ste14